MHFMKRGLTLPIFSIGLAVASSAAPASPPAQASGPALAYYGRASVKIRTSQGFVIYIDPYAPGDYSEAADLILVTHGHGDHNAVKLVTRKPGTVVAAPSGALALPGAKAISEGDSFSVGPVQVRVLPASNKNHPRSECVGYLISFDGLTIYHSGDTSWLPEMEGWASFHIDWALLCCDGYYNMGPAEALRCAMAMKAVHVIPHPFQQGRPL